MALMISDYRYHRLNVLRDYLSFAAYPIQWLVDVPLQFTTTVRQYTKSYQKLVQENQQLRQDQLLQNARTQKLLALEAENNRLRSLLQSSPRNGEKLLVAEIIGVDSDPLIHRVILDKGSRQGVTLGQSVIDAEGVIGEVIEVNPLTSRVILLTDTGYGIPVENVRNGVRGIAAGTGSTKNLVLQHAPSTIDLKPGDTLITSGLDGRYPSGYPVGTISEVAHDPGEAFARVEVTPRASLDRIRQVLLIQRDKKASQATTSGLEVNNTEIIQNSSATDTNLSTEAKPEAAAKLEAIEKPEINNINKIETPELKNIPDPNLAANESKVSNVNVKTESNTNTENPKPIIRKKVAVKQPVREVQTEAQAEPQTEPRGLRKWWRNSRERAKNRPEYNSERSSE